MMYLVLTALLALQVNSAILLKFRMLDEALKRANEKSVSGTQGQLAEMEKKASETKTKADLARLETGKQVLAKGEEMRKFFDELREKLIKRAGGYAEDKVNFANPNAEDAVAIIMLGGQGGKVPGGEAKVLKAKLDEFVSYINQVAPGVNPAPLTLDAKDNPVARIDEHQKGKKYAELNFENTPLVAALATLSEQENAVLRYEAEALASISGQLNKEVIKFTKIFPAVSAESKVVAAGTKYIAEMYLTASSDQIKPTMTMDGRPIKVENGKGKIEFTASPGAYDKDGNAKKTWTGKITFKQNGRDTSFTQKYEYIVAKPVVQVQSASVGALYLNCGNKLNIQVPALGSTYQPSFRVSGGMGMPNAAKKGEITVVPNARKVSIDVSSNGNKLSTENFDVRSVPRPEIKVMSGGREVNMKTGMSISAMRDVTLAATVEDEYFKANLKEDARYRVSEFEIQLARGSKPVGSPMKVGTSATSLASMMALARPGDRYIISVKGVQRKNFRDQVEAVSGVAPTFIVTLN